ncbi:rhomboid family intramembrane serine protease [Capnocytophaga catalasegens]|uniref:Rhomboid family intramembrane serine protease n=2 Tax=Capnocytophaga catalasegens TaxID=1004260 RepID=A0AAV5AZ47_9FLAO|nr:rhomboid family intramembrane serine protease [Capnocytophaga catalasegens]GJM50770.1 rhomboid family intramembrane serine protease [Capnocytophaga catalasegens]GJM51923.1 rhomboid family intramembrane serine protease [Capnocytophaga catalasegens]
MQITPAIKHLIIANVVFFIIAVFVPNFQGLTAIWFFENPNFHWWQFISHMFMHGGTTHLIFNMFALWSFGSPLEQIWGSNRFLFFYFACGLGAALIHSGVNYYYFQEGFSLLLKEGYSSQEIFEILEKGKYYTAWETMLPAETFQNMMSAYNTPAVGASGAVYGILVAFGMLFPNAELMLIFFPVPIKAKYFIPILVGLDLFSGITGFSIFGGNIAHFAHVGGALIGFILMWIWRKKNRFFVS